MSARLSGRLAAAGLAHEAHALAAREREARPLDGVQLAALPELEPDVQVLDFEHRRLAHAVSSRGGAGRMRKRPHREVADAQARVEDVLDRACRASSG